ncbi:vicilin-like seed storage protein At2g18540 isoform X3 [Cryptomeria japonica]|uniref:vicilin-like seed storage protein At2g18540 isoform X3 n=1 Tax=Cryptomeria japonica TaxID=3369 RepID=UPI0027D9D1EB|nr:vicilin-like seed storage protein At2g18540 isoform X3 [Cryptomeria japonica]
MTMNFMHFIDLIAIDGRSTGQSPSASSGLPSKKEKKKQAKEERDKKKQEEKKKRRLDKAVANSTAIRIELEQKKQKRKEEEKRLDEEGAALAEAVAMQVLGEEDEVIQTLESDFTNRIHHFRSGLSIGKTETGHRVGIKQRGNTGRNSETVVARKSDEQAWNMTAILEERLQMRNAEPYSAESGSIGEAESSIEEDFPVTNERARDAEITAELAAARAVAALQIAEEARAEAEAAKMEAQLSIANGWGKGGYSNSDRFQYKSVLPPKNAEEERDELKVKVLKMECMLLQKTRMISLLEQELEHAKQHMSELIHSMTTNSSNNDVSEGSIRRESEISSITVTKSSVDSVDPQDKW